MRKTAMQEVYENSDRLSISEFIDYIITMRAMLLEKEKQQIVDAYFEGCKDVSLRDMDDAYGYFNKTFTQ